VVPGLGSPAGRDGAQSPRWSGEGPRVWRCLSAAGRPSREWPGAAGSSDGVGSGRATRTGGRRCSRVTLSRGDPSGRAGAVSAAPRLGAGAVRISWLRPNDPKQADDVQLRWDSPSGSHGGGPHPAEPTPAEPTPVGAPPAEATPTAPTQPNPPRGPHPAEAAAADPTAGAAPAASAAELSDPGRAARAEQPVLDGLPQRPTDLRRSRPRRPPPPADPAQAVASRAGTVTAVRCPPPHLVSLPTALDNGERERREGWTCGYVFRGRWGGHPWGGATQRYLLKAVAGVVACQTRNVDHSSKVTG
jgi:hypothetical protein